MPSRCLYQPNISSYSKSWSFIPSKRSVNLQMKLHLHRVTPTIENICIYMYVYIYVYVFLSVSIYINTNVYVYIYTYVCTHLMGTCLANAQSHFTKPPKVSEMSDPANVPAVSIFTRWCIEYAQARVLMICFASRETKTRPTEKEKGLHEIWVGF